MKELKIIMRLIRRTTNKSIELMKVHPEIEQRTRIVDKIMSEGEPKNWFSVNS